MTFLAYFFEDKFRFIRFFSFFFAGAFFSFSMPLAIIALIIAVVSDLLYFACKYRKDSKLENNIFELLENYK